MPAKAEGTHKIKVPRSFCEGLAKPFEGEGPTLLSRLGLSLEQIDMSGLSSKAFTLLLQAQ